MNLWSDELECEVIETGSIQHITSIPESKKSIFKTSLDISWRDHLKHQKAFQNYTDNAVSKTINLPETTTIVDVSSIYKAAWNLKLKRYYYLQIW